MTKPPPYSIFLAAGKGTRMQSASCHKVCFPVDGVPAINRALTIYNQCGIARHIVVVGSLAVLGVKGGAFTIATAGSYRVYGPPETFIAENNAFAVALVMTIPLVRFLQLQLRSKAAR